MSDQRTGSLNESLEAMHLAIEAHQARTLSVLEAALPLGWAWVLGHSDRCEATNGPARIAVIWQDGGWYGSAYHVDSSARHEGTHPFCVRGLLLEIADDADGNRQHGGHAERLAEHLRELAGRCVEVTP